MHNLACNLHVSIYILFSTLFFATTVFLPLFHSRDVISVSRVKPSANVDN